MPIRPTSRRARSLAAAPLAAATLAVLTACAGPVYRETRTVYDAPRPAPRATYVEFGQVREIDLIQISRRPSGAGAVLGAVIGGVVGNQFGRGGGRVAATGIGAVAGAVAGNNVETNRVARDDEIFRVSVRFESGAVRDFDFHRIDDLRVGDRVRWENGQLYRA